MSPKRRPGEETSESRIRFPARLKLLFFYGSKFEVGDAVFVREGLLKGLRGVIDRLDRKKLHIHVDAIPGSVMIEVKPYQVQLEKDTVYSLVTNR